MRVKAYKIKSIIVFLLMLFSFQARSNSIVTINIDSSPVNLIPPLLTDTYANWIMLHIADRLVDEHGFGSFVSNLAETWDVDKQFKRYVISIKKDKYFSNGDRVTAIDVVNSLNETIKTGKSGRIGSYLREIKHVKYIGSSKIKIELLNSLPFFMSILADPMMSIYKHIGSEYYFTGDFQIKSHNKNEIVLLRKNDGLLFKLITLNFDSALEKFKKCNLDIIQTYALGQSKLVSAFANTHIEFAYGKIYFIAFNTKSINFDSIEKRKLFINSLNINKIREAVKNSGELLSNSIVPTSLGMGKTQFETIFNINKVKSNTSIATKLTILTQKSHKLSDLVDNIFHNFSIEKKDLEKTKWVESLDNGSYDLMLMGFGITVRDWDAISNWFESKAHFNFSKISDLSVDSLIRQARYESNPLIRIKLYEKLIKMNNNNFWYYPIAEVPISIGLSKQVKYLQNSSLMTPFINLRKVEIDRQKECL